MTKQEFISKLSENIFIQGDYDKNTVFVDYIELDLEKSLKVRNHSPTGFNWGYGGSGPAQLALSILLLYVDSKTAQEYYQDFKFGFIAGLPRDSFSGFYNIVT